MDHTNNIMQSIALGNDALKGFLCGFLIKNTMKKAVRNISHIFIEGNFPVKEVKKLICSSI